MTPTEIEPEEIEQKALEGVEKAINEYGETFEILAAHDKGTIQPGQTIVFGKDTIESLKEQKRKEEAEARKDKH